MNAKHWPKHLTYIALLNRYNDPVNEYQSLHLAGQETEARSQVDFSRLIASKWESRAACIFI